MATVRTAIETKREIKCEGVGMIDAELDLSTSHLGRSSEHKVAFLLVSFGMQPLKRILTPCCGIGQNRQHKDVHQRDNLQKLGSKM